MYVIPKRWASSIPRSVLICLLVDRSTLLATRIIGIESLEVRKG